MVANPARRGPRRDRHPDGGLRAARTRSGSSSWTRSTTAATSRTGRRATTPAGWRDVVPQSPAPASSSEARRPTSSRLARVRGGHAERAQLVERRVGRGPCRRGGGPSRGARRRQPLDLLHGAGRCARCAPAGERAGCPAPEPARSRHLHPVPRLRREPALPGLRAALRLPPRRGDVALPPLRPLARFRPRSARAAGAAASATSAPAPSASRPSCERDTPASGSDASTPTPWPRDGDSRRSTTTSARDAPTSSSARSSPPRASTCRRSRSPA